MGRGREPLVRCEGCGRRIPRDKSVSDVKRINLDLGEQKDTIVDLTSRPVFYCISCGKHRKIFEKKKEQARRIRERGRDL